MTSRTSVRIKVMRLEAGNKVEGTTGTKGHRRRKVSLDTRQSNIEDFFLKKAKVEYIMDKIHKIVRELLAVFCWELLTTVSLAFHPREALTPTLR